MRRNPSQSYRTSGAANRGAQGPGAPPKPCHKIFTDYEKYETYPVNRKVKSITGSVSLETVWRPGSARTCWGSHSAAPDSIAEFREGVGWQRKTAGQREGEKVRKGEKEGWEGREGWGGKEESKGKSGCAPPEKLNPGCATVQDVTCHMGSHRYLPPNTSECTPP